MPQDNSVIAITTLPTTFYPVSTASFAPRENLVEKTRSRNFVVQRAGTDSCGWSLLKMTETTDRRPLEANGSEMKT